MRIQAQFAGTCPECGGRIKIKEWIILVAGEWMHERCEEGEVESRHPTCPECFIQHAGECA